MWRLVVVLVACCVSQAQAANLSRFNGRTVAQFMLETMITPSDYFETGGKRVFIADKRAPDPRFGCSLQLVTVYVGDGKQQGPDVWKIEQIRYSGGCDFI
jgi:hypothetical protein